MSIKKTKLARRRFLQGMGLASGSILLSSVAGRLGSQVHGQVPTDACFVVSTFAHGTATKFTNPNSNTLEWSLPNFPLADIAEKVTTIEDVYNPHDTNLHGNYQSLLCGVAGGTFRGSPENGKSTSPGGPTIDRHMARYFAAGGVNRSINLGYDLGAPDQLPISNASGDGQAVIYPVVSQPVEAIAKFFGGIDAGDTALAQAQIAAEQRRSVLDFVGDDIERMTSRLASAEKATLDQYLTSIRELEVEAIAAANYVPPVCESPQWDNGEFIRKVIINENYMNFMYDFTGTALACGVSRVAAIHGPGVGFDPGNAKYNFIDPTLHIHDGVTHHLNKQFAQDYINEVFTWRAGLVRRLWDRLEGVAVGGSTLADNSILMWMNAQGRCRDLDETPRNNHFNSERHPVILLGSAGGKLRTGQAHRFEEGAKYVGDMFQTVANAFGDPVSTMGDPEHSTGAIEALLA